MINPLVIVLKESQHHGHSPRVALAKVMYTLCNTANTTLAGGRPSLTDETIRDIAAEAASAWHHLFGEPTYDSLFEYVEDWAKDVEHAEFLAVLISSHRETLKSLTPEDKAKMPYLE